MIAGLGNPGKEYNNTRHNIGFAFIDALAQEYDINVMDVKLKALTGKGMIGGQKVLLVKPLTFMNLSGESIRPLADYYKVDPESELIVVSDDITENFKRIRIGVGEKPKGYDLADYVLGHFSKEEQPLMQEGITKAKEALNLILAGNMDQAMNEYNRREK